MKKHILQENYERFFGKREFGDPLPTFKGVMEKHQINKLKEDWWDDMSPEDQASYIKKHPGSKQAQDAGGDEPEKITKGPGGYGDRGNVRGGDQRNFGEPDDEEYFKSMMGGDEDDYDMGVVPGSRELDDTPEDDSEKGSSLTSAPGRVPDEDEPDYSPDHPDNMDDDELKQFLDKDAEEDEGEPYKREPFQPGDDPEELSVGAAQDELEKAKAEMAHAEEMGDKAAYADAEEKEYALQVRLGITGRTGNELNQETLTIDGKQFRRISEGVEKQPKPKHAFSEFYQRFKK